MLSSAQAGSCLSVPSVGSLEPNVRRALGQGAHEHPKQPFRALAHLSVHLKD
jgi:hypothetical protein